MGQRTDDLKMKATKKWKFSRFCTKVAAALLRQKAAKLKLFCLLYVYTALYLEFKKRDYHFRTEVVIKVVPLIRLISPYIYLLFAAHVCPIYKFKLEKPYIF